MGWTTGTFTVSGWSGKRERIALLSGPVIATAGLACLTAVALLPGLALMTLSAFVMGIGIGVYNVHLVARAMYSVTSDEHRSTASALASVRSIGTAFGAAIARGGPDCFLRVRFMSCSAPSALSRGRAPP
jgi:hypothetical protein